jgi:hypothetical protein
MTNINNTMNKYETWYASITKRGQNRLTEFYTESHHIIPKCMGGEGKTTQWRTHPNIVLLTAEEHFNVHKLKTGTGQHLLIKQSMV